MPAKMLTVREAVTVLVALGIAIALSPWATDSLLQAQSWTPTDRHGNSIEDATELPEGEAGKLFTLEGTLYPLSDVDFFRVVVEEERYIQFRLTELSPYLGTWPNIAITLLDESGECAVHDCDHFLTRSTVLRLNAGTYYAKLVAVPKPLEPPELIWRHYGLKWIEAGSTRLLTECREIETDVADPLYGCQNNLKNFDDLGEDINVEEAWEAGVYGAGIKIAVIDVGVNAKHEDLKGVVDEESSMSMSDDGALYTADWEHGTQMAGILAANHNDLGGRGIAPEATLIAYRPRIIGRKSNDALAYRHTEIAVSNNSWGWVDPHSPARSRSGVTRGLEQGVNEGFDGKGVLYIFGASSGHNSNFSDRENHYATTAVCAVDESGLMPGERGEHSGGYGASLWVCAPAVAYSPSSYYNYSRTAGVSNSTAVVSGVTALVRSANPDLTWRDAKLILADSARKNDPDNSEWRKGATKYSDPDSSYWYNPNYGFGIVDAGAAVALAQSWTLLPDMLTASVSVEDTEIHIPDDGPDSEPVRLTATFQEAENVPAFVEHVEVMLDMHHGSVRDLEVKVISPAGTVSRLLWPTLELRAEGEYGDVYLGTGPGQRHPQHPVADHGCAGWQRQRYHRAPSDDRLRRPGSHLHRGRQDAIDRGRVHSRWAGRIDAGGQKVESVSQTTTKAAHLDVRAERLPCPEWILSSRWKHSDDMNRSFLGQFSVAMREGSNPVKAWKSRHRLLDAYAGGQPNRGSGLR